MTNPYRPRHDPDRPSPQTPALATRILFLRCALGGPITREELLRVESGNFTPRDAVLESGDLGRRFGPIPQTVTDIVRAHEAAHPVDPLALPGRQNELTANDLIRQVAARLDTAATRIRRA